MQKKTSSCRRSYSGGGDGDCRQYGIPTTEGTKSGVPACLLVTDILIRRTKGAQIHEQISKGVRDLGEHSKEICDYPPVFQYIKLPAG